MGWLKWVLVAVATLVVVAFVLVAWGAFCWQASTRGLVERLDAARVAPVPARYHSARELPGLPEPVQRFFRTVLTEGQPIVAAVIVEHRGMFNLSETGEQWKPFTSRQRVVTRRPGFVWDGRVAAAPVVVVHVHDAYLAGEGILHPALLGLVTLADLRGSGPQDGGIAQGELMRFLAEAAWYPTALLPSQGVRWEPVDERTARATMTDGALKITLSFGFADDGTMVSARAEARGRTVDGAIVMTPWEGRWSNVQVQAGMRVPMEGEVAWLTPHGRKSYWRGKIGKLEYEWAQSR